MVSGQDENRQRRHQVKELDSSLEQIFVEIRAVERIAGQDHEVDAPRGSELQHSPSRLQSLLTCQRSTLAELPSGKSQLPVGALQEPH